MLTATSTRLCIIVLLGSIATFLSLYHNALETERDEVVRHSCDGIVPKYATVLRYACDVPKGTIIAPSMLMYDTVEVMRMPCNVLDCINSAVGRESRYDLEKGALVGANELGFLHNQTGTQSIAESKKYNLFIGIPEVSPRSFIWNGHTVNIEECWFERCWSGHMTVPDRECNFLLFKANVVGKPQEYGQSENLRFLLNGVSVDGSDREFIDFATHYSSGALRYGFECPVKYHERQLTVQASSMDCNSKLPKQKLATTGQKLLFKLPEATP